MKKRVVDMMMKVAGFEVAMDGKYSTFYLKHEGDANKSLWVYFTEEGDIYSISTHYTITTEVGLLKWYYADLLEEDASFYGDLKFDKSVCGKVLDMVECLLMA